jgi:hypothetical protein
MNSSHELLGFCYNARYELTLEGVAKPATHSARSGTE